VEKNKEKMSDKIFDNPEEDDITDIIINEEDIKKAIGEIDPNSTAGPEGVSAKFERNNGKHSSSSNNNNEKKYTNMSGRGKEK